MTFMSCFTIYKFTLAYFHVSRILRFVFQLQKIQIIPTKYPKYAENNYGIFRGVTVGVSEDLGYGT